VGLEWSRIACRIAFDIFVLTSAYKGHVLAVAMANQGELTERLQAYHGTWIKVQMQQFCPALRTNAVTQPAAATANPEVRLNTPLSKQQGVSAFAHAPAPASSMAAHEGTDRPLQQRLVVGLANAWVQPKRSQNSLEPFEDPTLRYLLACCRMDLRLTAWILRFSSSSSTGL